MSLRFALCICPGQALQGFTFKYLQCTAHIQFDFLFYLFRIEIDIEKCNAIELKSGHNIYN